MFGQYQDNLYRTLIQECLWELLPEISRYPRAQSTVWYKRAFSTNYMWWGKDSPCHTHTRIIIAPSKMFTQQVETSRRTRYVFFPFFSFFLSKWNKFPNRIKKWTREMTGGYVQTLLISMLCTPSLLLLCWFYNSLYRCWIVKDMLGMPSHFFEQTLRLNAAGYTEVLETVLKPWIDLVCDGRPYVFQKDWTCSQCHSGPRLDGS